MKKTIILFLLSLAFILSASAQYYYIPYLAAGENPGGLNTDNENPVGGGLPPGWTVILAAGTPAGAASAIQSVPFNFDFDGNSFSQYRVNSHGVFTFDVLSALRPGANNVALPTNQVPSNSICVWGISNPGSNDNIVSKTFGTAPNRQHWVLFASFTFQGNWTYWSIVLEETSNSIYVVDQRHQNFYSGLTVGVQIDSLNALQLPASPNVATEAGGNSSSADNVYYEFRQGIQPDYDLEVNHLSISSFPNMADGPVEIHGELRNLGALAVTSYDLNYRVNGGTIQTAPISTSILIGGSEEFGFPTPWSPTSAGTYILEVWSSNINGNPDQNPLNDTAIQTVVVSAPIPNIIDDYLNSFPLPQVMATSLNRLNVPTDLDFHPDLNRRELWVTNYDTESSGGSTVAFSNVGMGNQSSQWKRDGNAWHFMSLPTGVAFSDNGNFANSTGVFDANHNGGGPFTGPALWSSDPAIYAQPSGGNGSHLDMLHASPNCMGIAHEKGNAFWVFDGFNLDITRYDFGEDHGPGNDDHDDGRIRRVVDFRVSMINNTIPSHLVLDKATDWLYIVDGGNKRVLRMDVNSGTAAGSPSWGPFEVLAEYTNLSNTSWEVIIDSGLVQPSGIEVIGDKLLVGDHANGHIIIYDISGPTITELKRIYTGTPGITGIKVGPEGYIWYVNRLRNELVKVEMSGVAIDQALSSELIEVYPNPSSGIVWINAPQLELTDAKAQLLDLNGRVIRQFDLTSADRQELDLTNISSGMYLLSVRMQGKGQLTKKIVIH